MDESIAVERRSPEAAFESLASELRVAILRALGEADGPLTFSELRSAVGERDSGKFNYHLGKLVGHFVRKDEDGYALSVAGLSVYGAIQSGAYTAEATVEPFEFEGPCPTCGNAVLIAEYTDERAVLSCPDCERWRNECSFPPASLDQYDRAELPRAFDRWLDATARKVFAGFCANCGGRVEGRLERSDTDASTPVRAEFPCGRCGDGLSCSPVLPVLHHPVTVSALLDRGVDVSETPSWRYFDSEADRTVEVATDEPLAVCVSIDAPGGSLVARVGADATVESIGVER